MRPLARNLLFCAGLIFGLFLVSTYELFPRSESGNTPLVTVASASEGTTASIGADKPGTCEDENSLAGHIRRDSLLAPAANNLCIAGSLSLTDLTFNRPGNQTTGSGLQATCTAPASVFYDAYAIELTGCAAFPTDVTMTLCGPAGCAPVASTDTVLHLYRKVPTGDELQANGGLPPPFNRTVPCLNVRAANGNLNGGASSTPGTGNTCNQANTSICLGACAANNSAAGFIRRLGDGRFVLVVSGTGSGDTGGYNLHVSAPGAGCNVAQVPTAANGGISGRVVTAFGRGIANVTVAVMGGDLLNPVTAVTNPFGYYTITDLPVGQTYAVTANSKRNLFANPTQVVTLSGDFANADFIALL